MSVTICYTNGFVSLLVRVGISFHQSYSKSIAKFKTDREANDALQLLSKTTPDLFKYHLISEQTFNNAVAALRLTT